MAWRVARVLDATPFVHAVVRPAVAAVTGAQTGLVDAPREPSASLAASARTVSAALWWTLLLALLIAGPLLALQGPLAAVFGVDAAVFGSLLRVFVLARLAVVAIGPGAEVLESSGHHRRRLRIALRVGLPGVLAGVVLVALGALHPAACVVALAIVLLELLQALDAWRTVGVDCSVLPLLRSGVRPVP